ncbi:MAG: ThiF family adenylyltransferase [Candidatus Thiodiazotropha endolucinida]
MIIDPQPVEDKNLNWVLHLIQDDMKAGLLKTAVSASDLRSIGLDIEVTEIVGSLHDPNVICAIAGCDVVMGCVDNREARQRLCQIAAYYLLFYIDTRLVIHVEEITSEIQSVNTCVF